MIAAIWTFFREIILKLGAWVADKLAELGVKALIRFFKSRVKKLKRKRKRFEQKASNAESVKRQRRFLRRVSWLSFRIDNWTKALKWAEAKQKKLTDDVAKELNVLVKTGEEKYPKVAPSEIFAIWDRVN